MMRTRFWTAALATSALLSGATITSAQTARPNIIVILSDDMGYSDIGCYGGEIRTPNLDALAADGLRFTQFYNTARCCPTRASLLTGLYPHQAGIGEMVAPKRDLKGYEADLSNRAATIAQVLTPAGYRCYMSGKWHVSFNQKDDKGELKNWPVQRGFERYYGIITGAADFFDPGTLCKQNTFITPTTDADYQPESYYLTDAISDYASRFIKEHAQSTPDKPFFCYVAYTAAHWPLHARPHDIERYQGKYDGGYTPTRQARFEKLKSLGLIEANAQLSPQAETWPADPAVAIWEADCMEVYAAMVDSMDQGVGRIVQTLRETNQLDNTLIFYLQDNGACAETIGREKFGATFGPDAPKDPATPITSISTRSLRDGRLVRMGPGVTPGAQDTYLAYGRGWANVSNTPFREYKHWVHEGGIATPLIVHWPAGIVAKNELRTQPGHLVDIMATCLDVSRTTFPKTLDGHELLPPEGKSLKPAFDGRDIDRPFLFWEHEGNRALRVGDYKVVAKGPKQKWELYDLKADRAELHDLSGAMPERRREMIDQWTREAERLMVLPWPWEPINNE